MSIANQIIDRLRQRSQELARVGALVEPEKLILSLIADIEQIAARTADAVNLKEASEISGYSVDHLQRLVASGKIENVGQRGRPRLRREDLPAKPGWNLRARPNDAGLPPHRRMALAVTPHDMEG